MVCARCESAAPIDQAALNDLSLEPHLDGAADYCVDCNRDRAAESVRAAMPVDAGPELLEHVSTEARVNFELSLDPERKDEEIAEICGSSLLAVRNARKHDPGETSGPLLA
jgi:hypothetical protein